MMKSNINKNIFIQAIMSNTNKICNLPKVFNFYVIEIIDNNEYFKNNFVIVPVQWFVQVNKTIRVCYPEPPCTSEDLESNENFAEHQVQQIPESWKKYTFEVKKACNTFAEAKSYLQKTKLCNSQNAIFNVSAPLPIIHEKSIANNESQRAKKSIQNELHKQAQNCTIDVDNPVPQSFFKQNNKNQNNEQTMNLEFHSILNKDLVNTEMVSMHDFENFKQDIMKKFDQKIKNHEDKMTEFFKNEMAGLKAKLVKYTDSVEEVKTLILKKAPLGDLENTVTLRFFKEKYADYVKDDKGEDLFPFQSHDNFLKFEGHLKSIPGMFEDLKTYIKDSVQNEKELTSQVRVVMKTFLTRMSLENYVAIRQSQILSPDGNINPKNVFSKTSFYSCLEEAFYKAYEEKKPRSTIASSVSQIMKYSKDWNGGKLIRTLKSAQKKRKSDEMDDNLEKEN